MNKDIYIRFINEKENLNDGVKKIFIKQIERYYKYKDCIINKNKYCVGENVKLTKGTLLHGTYKNIDGLKEIIEDGLISGWFIDGRLSKYPSCVGVWNLKKDYKLNDYVDFYSGGTILYSNIIDVSNNTRTNQTAVIPYKEMPNIINIVSKVNCHMWTLEQTKEARFLPSLVQNRVQIGIIFNGNNKCALDLLKGDILNPEYFNDSEVKPFVNSEYYEAFIKSRKNKDDFFTDRESAILFGVPANLIEGILVGRNYEKDKKMLKEIKLLIPDAYICNLDGKVIVGNK